MPIYLPPSSRRDFLRRSLIAGAGLLVAPSVLADVRPTDADSWAFFSDIHIDADPAVVTRRVNMTDHLKSVVAEVLALPELPAGVLVNGDCAHASGQTGDYARVAELLAPLRESGRPIHLLLGNHDNRERFWEALESERTAKRPLADRQVALVETPKANWFLMDSLEKTSSTPGLLGKEQLDWLATTLDAHTDKPALVFVHHNPGISGGNIGLQDTVALMEVIRPRKQVKVYFFGHTHVWTHSVDDTGLHLVNLPAVAYVFTQGEPSGWVHAKLASNSMRLELRCIDHRHKAHGQVLDLPWRKG